MYKQLIISLILVLAINTGSVFAQVTTEDSLALVEFYDSTGGIFWTNHLNWKTGPVGTWYGVFVGNGRVTGLELPNNGLVGTIPSSIGNLDSLETLYLNQNQLTGSIPSSIGNLTILRSIRLGFNQLTGSIPPEIGSLNALLYLNLEFNQLSGSIPSSIGDLTNLIALHIFNNQLTGSIPSGIGNLTDLELLYLFNNQLTGSIPASIGNLTNLTGLRLFNNQLTGSIPPEIGDLSNLLVLYLTSNQLTDSVPSEIGNLSKLRELYLEHNQFSGATPSSFVDLTDLTTLYIYDNEFTDLPDLSSLISLDDLRVQDNKFTFEDIEPNIEIPGFLYSPQDSVGESQDTTINQYSSFTMSVSVGGDSNQYQWKRDGDIISGATDSSYTISSADSSDAGSYVCEITNTVATALTLYSRPINVTVNASAVPNPDLPNAYSMSAKEITMNKKLELRYTIPVESNIRFGVYDITGKLVKEISKELQPGFYLEEINMNGVPTGVYFVRMAANGKEVTKTEKVVLVR